MTDLFNQFGGDLSDFKMRNIDSASFHEIICEFAPLIGVATDSIAVPKVNKNVEGPLSNESAVKIEKEIKQEKQDLEDKNVEVKSEADLTVNSDLALDLSLKPKTEAALNSVKDEKPITIPVNSLKRENSDSLMIDHSVYKKYRHAFETHKFDTRNSCSPVNLLNEKGTVENVDSSLNSSKDSDFDSSKAAKLLYEIKSANDLKYYQCKLCPKVYDTKYHLNRHLISHGGNRPHCCDKCGKSFSQKCDLNRHMHVHNNTRKHACSVCGKGFKRADYLSKHERQYCGVFKPHKCTKCHKGFEELSELEEHTCIQRLDGSKFSCESCEEKFESVDALVEHRKTHKVKTEEYQCTKCKEEFTEFASYVEHFKQHSGDRPYTCDLCRKVFTRNHNLMTHMWIHNQEKQHTCQICAKTFTYYSNLQVHLRVHRNERPYKCEECDKGFLTSSDLRRHKRTHSGEKPYKCNQCPAEYARKERLISHMITHVEEGMEARDLMVDGLSGSLTEETSKDGSSHDGDGSKDGFKAVREVDGSDDSSMVEENYYAEEEMDN